MLGWTVPLKQHTVERLHSAPHRAFSATAIQAWKSHTSALEARHANVPEYPYGPAKWYKQSNKGLYGGQTIRFGNNVGEKSSFKTRRAWHPNVINRRFRSPILGETRLRLTTRVLRTIDKVGGLEAYLLSDKPQRIKDLGMEGWKLRHDMLKKLAKGQQDPIRQADGNELVQIEKAVDAPLIEAKGAVATRQDTSIDDMLLDSAPMQGTRPMPTPG